MTTKAVCKNCGQSAPAESFRLHYKFRMIVCPSCYSGRTAELRKKEEEERKQELPPKRPAGWDEIDDYLERATSMHREENQAQFSKITGTDYVKCKCANCRYSFKYDPYRKQPLTCPYCDTPVPRLRTFNLL